jgi:Golgi phosphoprotein 3 (GPP34)
MRPRLLVADELFLAAHHDQTGKPRAATRAISLGLAGGLLGELMLFGRITTRDETVLVVDHRAPADALAHTVLDHLTAERSPWPLRTWINFLGQSAAERVASRLERAGHLRQVESRRLLRTETHWLPTDSTTAVTPGLLLRHHLQNEKPLTVPDAVLAGLIEASGLSHAVLWGTTSRTAQYRDWCVSALTSPLRELIAETSAAVGNAVLTHRA